MDALITGTITPFGESVRTLVKILDTETARVIGASSENIAKTQVIEELLARGIETGVAPATPTPAAPRPPAVAQQSVEVRGLLFQLEGCRLSGQTATCSLIITNKGNDINLWVLRDDWSRFTRIFDDSGNEYRVSNIQLGNKSDDHRVTSLLVSGVPTKLVLSFEGVSSKAAMVSLLDIGCDVEGTDFQAQLRNIPLTR